MAQNHIIAITHGDPKTGILDLSDKGKTFVDPGDTVTWLIQNGSGVKKISSIIPDPGSNNVFKPDPEPVGASTNWKGTVNPSIPKGTLEDYTICWVADDGKIPPCFDPKIQVNP